MSISVANEGPVPVDIVTLPSSQLGVDTTNFAFSDQWNLAPLIYAEETTVGATKARRFPAVTMRALVTRHPGFALMNVALPMDVIALLSLATFVIPLTEQDGDDGGGGGKRGSAEGIAMRLDLSMTILLTAVAFKFVTVSFLPQISYLTLIDKFVLMCMGFLVLNFTLHTVSGVLLLAEIDNAMLSIIDWCFLGLLCLLYILKVVWFCAVSWRARSLVAHWQTLGRGSA